MSVFSFWSAFKMPNVLVWTEGLNVSKCMRFQTKTLKFLKLYWLLKLSPTDVNKKITKLIFTDFLIPKILRALLLKHITHLAYTKNMNNSSQFITAIRTSSVYAKSMTRARILIIFSSFTNIIFCITMSRQKLMFKRCVEWFLTQV